MVKVLVKILLLHISIQIKKSKNYPGKEKELIYQTF
jgi:hypothetical protein